MKDTDQKVICLESTALYFLIDEVVNHIKDKFQLAKEPKWIDTGEAMHVLNIKSKSTLQTLRDNGLIAFSQPSRKVILYDRESLMHYLESFKRETF